MADSPTACGICNEEYTSNARCPRILHCFHTLCTSCIENLIRSNAKQCPFCRMNFTACKVRDVAVNHTMLELMKYSSPGSSISSQEPLSGSNTAPVSNTSHNMRIDNLKRETIKSSTNLLVTCQEAQRQVEKAINEAKDLNIKFCQENTKIENVLMPKINTISSQNAGKSEDLDRTTEALHEKLKEVKGKQRQLEELKGKLDAATSFREAAAVMDVAEETNSAIREWIDNFKDFISFEEQTLEASQQEIKVTKKKIDIMVEAASSENVGFNQQINVVQDALFQPVVLFMLVQIFLISVWPDTRSFFSTIVSAATLPGLVLLYRKRRVLGEARPWWRFF